MIDCPDLSQPGVSSWFRAIEGLLPDCDVRSADHAEEDRSRLWIQGDAEM
jgi:hypothetical protein